MGKASPRAPGFGWMWDGGGLDVGWGAGCRMGGGVAGVSVLPLSPQYVWGQVASGHLFRLSVLS